MYHQNHAGQGTMVPWSEVVVVIELVSSKSIRLTLDVAPRVPEPCRTAPRLGYTFRRVLRRVLHPRLGFSVGRRLFAASHGRCGRSSGGGGELPVHASAPLPSSGVIMRPWRDPG
jgi:hypothetical protein